MICSIASRSQLPDSPAGASTLIGLPACRAASAKVSTTSRSSSARSSGAGSSTSLPPVMRDTFSSTAARLT